MPLSSKKLTILENDLQFSYAGNDLVLSIREGSDGYIDFFVGMKDGSNSNSSFYWAFDMSGIDLGFESWIESRAVIDIMNIEIQNVYGSYSESETQLWEQLSAYFKSNYTFNSTVGLTLK